MLEIITENGISLDLFPNTSIPMVLTNPMFEKTGSHSQGFDLQATPKNLLELGFPDRVEATDTKLSINVKTYLDGIMFLSSTLTVKRFDNKIRGYLAENEGNFTQRVKDKKLSEFNYEKEDYWHADYETYLLSVTEKKYPEANFAVFPVYNTDFFLDTPHYDNPNYDYYLNNQYHNYYYYYGGSPRFSTFPNKLITPFVYLCYVIDIIFEQSGYSVVRNYLFENEEYRSLTLFNLNQVRRDDPYATGNHNYSHNLGDQVPDMTVTDFIEYLKEFFNITFFIDDIKREVRILKDDDIIRSKEIKDITDIVQPNFEIEKISSSDGIELNMIGDENDLMWEEHVKDIYEGDALIGDTVSDLAALQLIITDPINTIRLVTYYDSYYKYSINDSTLLKEWQHYSYNFQSYISGDREILKELKITPMIDFLTPDFQNVGSARGWNVPAVKYKGNDPDLYQNMFGQKFELRMLFYRGLIDDSIGDPYPYANAETFVEGGTPVPGATKSLSLNGENGIFNNFWKHTAYWLISERNKIKPNIMFSKIDIASLKMYDKYRIDDINYLIKRVEFSVSMNGIKPAKVEMYSV